MPKPLTALARATIERIQELTATEWKTANELHKSFTFSRVNLDNWIRAAFEGGYIQRRGRPQEFLSTGKKPEIAKPKKSAPIVASGDDEDKGFTWPFNCRVCGELITISFETTQAMYNTWVNRKFTCSQCSTLYVLRDYADDFQLAYGASRCMGDRASKLRLGKSRGHSFA
jgi:hypothetical protein